MPVSTPASGVTSPASLVGSFGPAPESSQSQAENGNNKQIKAMEIKGVKRIMNPTSINLDEV